MQDPRYMQIDPGDVDSETQTQSGNGERGVRVEGKGQGRENDGWAGMRTGRVVR